MYDSIYNIQGYIKACGDNAPKLQQILDDHQSTFDFARGSLYKHQAWQGGYLQHVSDCIQLANYMYDYRHNYYGETKDLWPISFSWASVVLVLFLHNIEKPFMQMHMSLDSHMPVWNKTQRVMFRGELIAKYDLKLTHEEIQALLYVEGEGADYNPEKRIMNELGALCHAADTLSSRLWYDRNKPTRNE